MTGYLTRDLVVPIGGHDYRIRALRDTQQFSDPIGDAERVGISSATWSLFGQVWPAGRVLAEAMSFFDVAGKRVLEIGCGLGLSSLVLQRRRADITASDNHPLAEFFLARNAELNHLPPVPYRYLSWALPDLLLGRFDVVIGADILYERGHAALLAAVLLRHARPEAEVVITDPGRGNSGPFTRAMGGQGFSINETRQAFSLGELPPHRGRTLSYRR